MTWQPIETAPKDKDIWLWDGKQMVIGRWGTNPGSRLEIDAPRWEYSTGNGWGKYIHPTKWHPLPDKPIDDTEVL